MPVGAGRRKNKSSAAKEAVREQARKASCKESSMDTSFLAFPGMVDPALSAYGPGLCPPHKSAPLPLPFRSPATQASTAQTIFAAALLATLVNLTEELAEWLVSCAGPMAPGKAGIPGFVPNLAVPAQLSPLALQPYPTVDPAAASALQGCLAAAFDGSVPQPSFGGSCLSASIMYLTDLPASQLSAKLPLQDILVCLWAGTCLSP